MKNELKIPNHGLNISRKLMPQLGQANKFLDNIEKHDIKWKKEIVNTDTLRATQGEFNRDAIISLMTNPKKVNSAVVISSDNYVLDGHHRWLAIHNMHGKIDVIRIDLPILELLSLVKRFDTTYYKDVKDLTNTIKKISSDSVKSKKYK